MLKVCANCDERKELFSKNLCKKCYEISDDYKQKRNIRRLVNGREQAVSQIGRTKPRKKVNEILRKVKRTGGLTDSEETIIADINVLKHEIYLLEKRG